jgi:hypothetical protein
MSHNRYYNQIKLNKKYLKGVQSDPSQSKLVFHDVMYQGEHHRQLGATGYNPVFNPAPVVQNYGPVFGSNLSISAPMVFGGVTGDYISNSNNSSTVNRGQSVPLVSNAKDFLSNRQFKRTERQENIEKIIAIITCSGTGSV